jgi:hypothetical protein
MRTASLLDVIDYLELLAVTKPQKLEAAAIRWHGRLELEAGVMTLEESQLALAALASLCAGDREALEILLAVSDRQRCEGNAMRRGGMDDQALCHSRPYRAVNAVLHCPYLGSRSRREHSGSPVFLGVGTFTLRPPVLCMSQPRGDFPGSLTGRESPPPSGNDAIAATHLSREVRTFRTSSGRRALPPCIRSKYDLSYQDGARGQHEPMTPQGRSLEQVLVALGTNEHVASALRRYPQRDTAIEALEDDVDHQRRGLVADLRAVMRERSALQVAGRMRRDAYLTR